MPDVVTKPTAQLLSIEQVADLCGVSRMTIRRLMETPPFPTPLRLGVGRLGAIRFRQVEIEAWIEMGCPHD